MRVEFEILASNTPTSGNNETETDANTTHPSNPLLIALKSELKSRNSYSHGAMNQHKQSIQRRGSDADSVWVSVTHNAPHNTLHNGHLIIPEWGAHVHTAGRQVAMIKVAKFPFSTDRLPRSITGEIRQQ